MDRVLEVEVVDVRLGTQRLRAVAASADIPDHSAGQQHGAQQRVGLGPPLGDQGLGLL